MAMMGTRVRCGMRVCHIRHKRQAAAPAGRAQHPGQAAAGDLPVSCVQVLVIAGSHHHHGMVDRATAGTADEHASRVVVPAAGGRVRVDSPPCVLCMHDLGNPVPQSTPPHGTGKTFTWNAAGCGSAALHWHAH